MESNKTIHIPFYIRFDEWVSSHSLSGIWDSLIWLEELLPKLLEVSGIQSNEIKVNIKSVKWWCIIFWLDINLLILVELFRSAKAVHDFLAFIWPNFETICNIHRNINDYAAHNPVDFEIIKILLESWTLWTTLSYFLKKLIKILPNQKNYPITQIGDIEIPNSIAQKSHSLVQKSVCKRTINPIFEGRLTKMEYSDTDSFENSVEINPQNSWDYVSDNQQILPEWISWSKRKIIWEIVTIQKRKWNSATIRVNWLNKSIRDLTAYPVDTLHIEEFSKLFGMKNIEFEVEISRVSLYEKPKLIVHTLNNVEQQLPI